MSTFTYAKTGFIAVLLLFLSLGTRAQLHAEFSATPLSGCAPLVVNFHDQSTGNPTQWRWDLGNGTISFLQNPSVTYFLPGQYNIKLIVQKPGGIDSIIKTQYITIYAQPVVQFTASNLSGCFPLQVDFTDQSSSVNSTITTWQWDFGDGNFGNTQNPTHTYTSAGNFNVSLVVTNNQGCFKSLTKPAYIQIADGVTADFSNSTASSCTPPVNINFQNLSTGTGVLTYLWNFGDGVTSNASTPSHNYTSTGSYNVQLIVTNSSGCSDTIIHNNAVTIGNVTTSFTSPDSSCVGTNITFTNTSAPAPASSFWDFGDGTNSTSISPVKSYALPGTYQVKLVNNFGACSDSLTKTITISGVPNAGFFTNDTLACKAPFTVNFTDTSTGAVSYLWTFGDGGTSNLQNPVHVYNTAGVYQVTLVCTNAFGCSSTMVKPSYINIIPPQVTINSLPQQGCAPLSWTFGSTSNSIEPITTYQWDFGDGGTSNLPTPTHVYSAGIYTVSLIVTTAGGCSDTTTIVGGIRAGTKPTANFNATPNDVCANMPVNFHDLSTGTFDQWNWDFGDGGTSIMQNPIHIYADTGYFDVQLIVMNNGCPDTIKFLNYVHIKPPIASFTVSSTCKERLKRIFTDHSIGADEWNWDFGDGNTSTLQNPVHIYAGSGTYLVTLTVRNNTTGCTYPYTSSQRVIQEIANFTVSDTVICRTNSVTFTAVGSNPANVGAYQWNFGDGATATGLTVNHTYTVSGVYDIRLIAVDWNGCRDTLIRQHLITVTGPTAGFTVPTINSCLANVVTFTDTSSSDGTHPISQWIWNYGDGHIDTLTSGPFQHNYITPGIYSVTLTVIDSNGCVDSVRKTNLLTISKPIAGFYGDTLSCPGKVLHFFNTSTGNALVYHWSFGDGGISINANPSHTYATDGLYTVKLVIVDQFGCTDSITKTNYVRITTPSANFTVSDSVGTCPPLIVTFLNTSVDYTSFLWNFGDGSTSTNPAPAHFYNVPGTYFAVLTITGPGGCISTKQQKITVRGPYGSFVYNPLNGCQPLSVNFTATTQDRVSFIWDFSDGSTLATTDSVVSHAYTIPGHYVPRMILLDAAGCTVPITGPDTIHVHGVQADFNFNPPLVCDSGLVQFTSTSVSDDAITTYSWLFDDGSTGSGANPSHFYHSPGLYYPSLTVTTNFGCKDSIHSTLPVKIIGSPQGLITQSANGCTPITVTFSGSLAVADTSAMTWQWNFGNGDTSTLMNPPVQHYTASGTFPVNLIVSNSLGCRDTVATTVEAYIIPTVSAGPDTLICQGTGRTLQASGAATYSWSPSAGLSCTNCANPVATPDSLTTYVVEGTTIHGCTDTDTVKVSVKYPFAMTASPGDTLCVGSSVKLSANGAYAYTWSPSTGLSNTNTASTTASPIVTTTYTVIGVDDKNCFTDTARIPIRVFNIPVVEAGPDKTINVGQTLDLVPVISPDVTSVVWSPTGSIFRSDYPAVSVKPNQSTSYIVDVVNGGGCRSRDHVMVYVICDGSNVFIPNTFSPNNDGANDVFYPRGKGLFKIKNARIFNRWGEIVYEKSDFMPNDVSAGWDGTYKGQKLNSDVYVYIIDIMCDNNTVLTYKGNIALIK